MAGVRCRRGDAGSQGLRYARVERLGGRGALVAVAVNVTLGLVLVLLEVLVSH